jgi:hypothetical protein
MISLDSCRKLDKRQDKSEMLNLDIEVENKDVARPAGDLYETYNGIMKDCLLYKAKRNPHPHQTLILTLTLTPHHFALTLTLTP